MTNKNICDIVKLTTILGELTMADVKFLLRCREMNFGLIDTVVVKGGSPVLARRSEPQEKFD